MKRTFITFIVFSILISKAYTQQVDYNKIILPDEAANISFEEKLVQLAWKNNPQSSIVQGENKVAQYEARAASAKWLGLFGAQGNLNEFTIKKFTGSSDNTTNNAFYPRYNVYVNVPLSVFTDLGNAKKAARQRVVITQDRINATKLDLRANVLKLYSEYRKNEDIVNIYKEAMEDEESTYLVVEQKFKNGQVSVEDYMNSQKSRNTQRIQLRTSENEYRKAKLDLEAVIGVRLEDVR